MFAKVVADRYARAVLHNSPDLATIERVKDELALLRDAFETQDSFRAFLLNPKMPVAVKRQILESTLRASLHTNTMELLFLLLAKARQHVLPDIADRYAELCDQYRGVEHADVVTAVPIPAALQDSLKLAVQRFSARQVEVSMQIDPKILGGVIVRLGGRIVDGSLRRRFEDTRRAMLAARLPRMGSDSG